MNARQEIIYITKAKYYELIERFGHGMVEPHEVKDGDVVKDSGTQKVIIKG